MKRVLARVVNKNQLLIISALTNNSANTITSLLNNISRKEKIPLSTLKLNAKILKSLGLIDFGNGNSAMLTEFGIFFTNVVGDDPK